MIQQLKITFNNNHKIFIYIIIFKYKNLTYY